jgi:hypothetical protein
MPVPARDHEKLAAMPAERRPKPEARPGVGNERAEPVPESSASPAVASEQPHLP